ncbi:MAG: carboxypeptidase-like regulatory domain-containing protein, partial [Draconibacterium sp.]|nr:carboxypeptidase-like regulatory domain-containing protein [Draconibacterium sp.]
GMVLTSYINTGVIDVGPVFDIYSTNAIEGNRFTVPIRTGEKLFEKFTVGGFVGYGTKNKEFKFGMNAAYQLLPTDKYIFRVSYSNDYNLVSQDKFLKFIKKNPNTKGNGNFIAAVTSREQNPYLKEEKNFNFTFEYNAREDITINISPYYLLSKSTPDVHFVRDYMDYNQYENYGILMNLRLAFGQYYDKYYFARVYYIDQIPVINLSWDIGKTKLPNNAGNSLGFYSHLHGSIVGKLNMGQSFMRYMINGGYLFGDAPYDLLDQPVGSMSLGYAKYRFNLLHHASFAHNLYSNIHLDFNGGGIIFNRLPFIRKFKLREMVSLKSHYGSVTNSYNGVFDLPDYYNNEGKKPYAEIGFGITNIFKVLRVEYVRQLTNTYTGSGFTDKNGIRFRAEMSF